LFGGGIADKFGNDYEALWTVSQVLAVLRAEARSIRLEGIRPEFAGFEFAVDHGTHTAWHQTKINNPNGNWTIIALQREGVLPAFAARLGAGATDRCIFVSQSPASDLADLASKASYADGFPEFQAAIGKIASEKFVQYHTTLGITPETAFDWLRRTDCWTLPQVQIEGLVAAIVGITFQESSTAAIGALRHYLQSRLNRSLTTELLRVEIPSLTPLNLKDWNLDPTLPQRLRDETAAYLATYTPFGAAGETIGRQQVPDVLAKLTDERGPQVILLSGVAGSGKSGVVRGVIDGLSGADIPHFALRIDQYLDCKAPADLGRALLQRNESPVITLKGLSPDAVSVLVIDQIDAVSEVSGRNGAAKNAVLRMIDEARHFRSVRVVLVCRSFDIESDERIKQLKKANDVIQIDVPLLEWDRDVVPVLERVAVAPGTMDAAQRALLCLPLNLSVFAEIAGQGDTQFASRNDLFAKLVELKTRAIATSRDAVPWSLLGPLSALASWMSERQRLDAPFTILDEFPRAVDILVSEHLIVRNRDTVNFFHESFFDYVFARSFALRNQRVVDLLTSSEQHLFRRTQVRQILESLRQSDHPRYLQELEGIWNADGVRYHIKLAVAQWLGALSNPTEEERQIIVARDDATQPLSPLVRSAMYGTAGWFDVLAQANWFPQELRSASEPRRQTLMWWFGTVAGARPEPVAALLDEWWSGDPTRGAALLEWFGYIRRQGPDQALVSLCERVIRSHPAGLFGDKGEFRRELLIATWAVGDSGTGAAAILNAYFDAWYEQHPGRHPFEREELRDIDLHALGELAKKWALAVVDGSMPALLRAFDLIASKRDSDGQDYSFSFRTCTGHPFGSDAYLRLLRDALRSIAAEDAALAREKLRALNPNVHEAATHLHLETIAANGRDLAPDLLPLLESPFLFDAGWHGADWKSFADAAKAALPFMDGPGREAVEAAILAYRPELADVHEYLQDFRTGLREEDQKDRRRVLRHLSSSGYKQFCILETIGDEILSERPRARLAELRRKFSSREVQKPGNVEVHAVESPISKERAEHMSDDQWLAAIDAHNSEDERVYGDGFITGGARQLAHVLQTLTKQQPQRFARLQLRIPDAANPAFVQQLLWGLADADDAEPELIAAAIEDAYRRDRQKFADGIIRIIERHPELGRSDRCWSILTWYIVNGDAQESDVVEAEQIERETVTIDDLINRGSKLHIRGVNGARGSALEALAAVLWAVPERNDEAWSVIESRVQLEDRMGVRCCIPRALTPLFNVDKQRCAALLDQLVGDVVTDRHKCLAATLSRITFGPERLPNFARVLSARAGAMAITQFRKWHEVDPKRMSPLVTHPATHLLPYIIYQVPEVGRRLLMRLLIFGDPMMRLVGTWHVVRTSYNDIRYLQLSDTLERASLDARRLAADVASHAIRHDTFVERAALKLRGYFHDDDAEVRKQASETFRSIPPDQFASFFDLSREFVRSPAYEGDSFAFLHALETAACNVAELVILAAERVIMALKAGGPNAKGRDMNLYQIKDLIKTEYAASEREPELRRRLLDIVDEMLLLDLSGVDEITKSHER